MEELISSIANLGFPIAVSVFLLVRFDSRIDELTKSIDKLTGILSKDI